MDIDTSDRKQQRNFGLVMAVAITVLGLIRWAIHRGEPPYVFFGVAAVFLVLGLLIPAVLRPVLIVWIKFAEALNWFMTRFLLTIAFFAIILPTALIMRLAGKDPLNRKWDPNAETYWEDPEDQPADIEHYLNQF